MRPLYIGYSVFQKNMAIPTAPSSLPKPQDGPETLSLMCISFLSSDPFMYQDLTLVYYTTYVRC